MQERYGATGVSPVKDYEDDEGIEASHIQGQAERAGTVQSGEKKVIVEKEGRDRLFSVVSSGRTRGNKHKLKHLKLHLNTRKHVFTVKMVEHQDRLAIVAVVSIHGDIQNMVMSNWL